MSIYIEKMNHVGAGHEEIKSTKGLKETLKHDATMFVCEEHVTLWITTPSRNKKR